MSELLARVVAIGLVAALVPVPIFIVLVVMAGPRGLVRAWWFVLGFAGSLFVAGAAGLLIASQLGVSFNPWAMSAIALVIGVAFLLIAARLAIRQGRGHGGSEANAPMLSGLSGGHMTALGVVAGALNPKTLPIFLTGVAVIASNAESAPMRSLALVLLAGTASMGVVAPPLLLTVVPGQRTARVLARVQRAIEPHVETVAIVLLVLVGTAYVIFGAAGLR